MNELIVSLMMVASTFARLPVPEVPPQVHFVGVEEVQGRACGDSKCPDLHFYTDPKTNIIYVNKDVNFDFTLAKAELLHEITRYVLISHNIYSPTNPCSRNVKIEMALGDIEFDFIKSEVQNGKYVGKGLPEPDDLPKHVFYCTPDKAAEPKEELKV